MLPYQDKKELTVLDFAGLRLDTLANQEFNSFLLVEENGSDSPQKNAVPITQFNETDILVRGRNSIEGVIGVKEIAAELSSLIKQMSYEQGRMIGIFGKWGRGKTFAMNETWDVLNATNQFERIDFHAWLYQDTQAAWAYLYEQFSNAYYNVGTGFKGLFRKIVRRLYLNIKRLGWYELAQFLFSFATSIASLFLFEFNQKFEFGKQIIYTIGVGVTINIFIIYFSYKDSAKGLFRKYYKKTSFSSFLGVQAEVNKELKNLIEAWSKWLGAKKLILFVDDIDRCSEDRIIQIIDALRVMLEDQSIGSKLVVVTAIDERILMRSIKHKYSSLVKFDGDNKKDENEKLSELTREYIDKLFILSIKLGDLEDREKAEYFDELTKEDRIIETIEMPTTPIVDLNETETDQSIQDEVKEKINDTITTNNKERIEEISKQVKKLTTEEIHFLRESLKAFRGATPRQIRIYYFRYLLTKSLLIKRYGKNGRENIWISQLYGPILMQLLIQYGWVYDANLIQKHFELVSKDVKSEFKVFLIPDRFIPREDYLELLKVLEITSAY